MNSKASSSEKVRVESCENEKLEDLNIYGITCHGSWRNRYGEGRNFIQLENFKNRLWQGWQC